MVAVAHPSPVARRQPAVRPSPAASRRLVLIAAAAPAARPGLRTLTMPVAPPVAQRHVAAATYRRRRAAALALAAALAGVLSLAVHGLLSTPGGGLVTAPGRPEAAAQIHVVQPGDTFWAIARHLRPNEDPRPLVAQMVAAHGGPVLAVGERIRLPA